MAVYIKRRIFRWIKTSRQFSLLIVVLLLLNQSFIFFDSLAGNVKSSDPFSPEVIALPSYPSECTLSKRNNRNIVLTLEQITALAECQFFSLHCINSSYSMSKTRLDFHLLFHNTAAHLRV